MVTQRKIKKAAERWKARRAPAGHARFPFGEAGPSRSAGKVDATLGYYKNGAKSISLPRIPRTQKRPEGEVDSGCANLFCFWHGMNPMVLCGIFHDQQTAVL